MTPRRPHLLLPTLLLALPGLAGCGEDRATALVSDPAPSATTVSSPNEKPTQQPAGDRFPDDVALDHGLDKSEQWSDFGLEGPGRDVAGVSMVDFCEPDPTTWPGLVADRIAVRETGPEYEQSRELLLYASAQDARDALGQFRALVESCPEVPLRPGRESNEDRLHLLLPPTASDTVTAGVHYRLVLGSGVYQVRRVGRTLLAARDLGEGSRDGLEGQARNLTASLDDLLEVLGDDLP